jgi:undecaprenyl pyrophosphate phosphatase UppP
MPNSDHTQSQPPTDLQVLNAIHGMMLGKAQQLDLRALQLQIAALAVNVIGLLLGMRYQTIVPLIAGLIVMLLLLCWLIVFRKHLAVRSVGERARRLHLLVDSLEIPLSAADKSQLFIDADTDIDKLAPYIQKDFFGAFGPTGTSRLIESVWESAFFSESLHKKSGERYRMAFWSVLAILALGIVGIARIFLHSATVSAQDAIANIVLAGGLVAIVSELFLRAERHDQAVREIAPLQTQLCGLYQSHKPSDSLVFLVIGNYNAAVECAPMIPKSVYINNRDKLNRQFAAVKEAADKAKAGHSNP